MTPLLYGVGAAIAWGVADYSGALSARRIGSLWTSLGMQAVGSAALAVALLALGAWPPITGAVVPWAVGLAAIGGFSLFLLYRGLALGPIAVVSPIVASYSARTEHAAIAVTGSGLYPLLPAFLGIVRHGERLAPNQYVGIVVVVGGLVALGLRS